MGFAFITAVARVQPHLIPEVLDKWIDVLWFFTSTFGVSGLLTNLANLAC
jgi:hypothetical protein